MLTEDLLSYIFDGQPHLLAQSMVTWLSSSRRFTAFVTTFRDKIRKKRRATRDEESLLDLRLEWETAFLLLQERLLSLVYEPQLSRQLRGPDFAVTYTTSITFMIEVTRLQTAVSPVLAPGLKSERVADAICGKLVQLLPQHSHVLMVSIEALHLTHSELGAAMLCIQHRVERNDVTLLQRHQLQDRTDFFRHYQRLNKVLVRGPRQPATEPVVVWVNPQAKFSLPSKVRTALYRSHSG